MIQQDQFQDLVHKQESSNDLQLPVKLISLLQFHHIFPEPPFQTIVLKDWDEILIYKFACLCLYFLLLLLILLDGHEHDIHLSASVPRLPISLQFYLNSHIQMESLFVG